MIEKVCLEVLSKIKKTVPTEEGIAKILAKELPDLASLSSKIQSNDDTILKLVKQDIPNIVSSITTTQKECMQSTRIQIREVLLKLKMQNESWHLIRKIILHQ